MEKLTEQQKQEIRERHAKGESARSLARSFGVSTSPIFKALGTAKQYPASYHKEQRKRREAAAREQQRRKEKEAEEQRQKVQALELEARHQIERLNAFNNFYKKAQTLPIVKAYTEGGRIPANERINGLYYYDIGAEGLNFFYRLHILANHCGVLITNKPIKPLEEGETLDDNEINQLCALLYCESVEALKW